MDIKIEIAVEVLVVLRDALREKGRKQILTEAEYDALLHVNAKLETINQPLT